MNELILLQQIFQVCIIPLLGVLTGYAVSYIKRKTEEIQAEIKDKKTTKYVEMLSDTIVKCVIATNQTYVDSLKNKEVFTKEAQEEAFNRTFTAIKQILSEEAKECLAEVYGDLDKYITEQIESTVNQQKK